MPRSYRQYCGLARAMELVGGRWTLLVVRELLTGPKRYGELAQGLPGIASNVLAARLRELEDAGVVERTLEARPSTSVVYALTPFGHGLREPIISLGLWGARALGPPEEGDCVSGAGVTLALAGAFDATATGRRDLKAELHLDGVEPIHAVVASGNVTFPDALPGPPDVVLEMPSHVLAELLQGIDGLDAAVAAGRVRIAGPTAAAHRFFEIFRLHHGDTGRAAPTTP